MSSDDLRKKANNIRHGKHKTNQIVYMMINPMYALWTKNRSESDLCSCEET